MSPTSETAVFLGIGPETFSTPQCYQAEVRGQRAIQDGVRLVNEVLCNRLCDNICCYILEQRELGIEPSFGKRKRGKGLREAICECQELDTIIPSASGSN